MKKILLPVILIVAVLLTSGCGTKEMTADEYMESFTSIFTEYSDNSTKFVEEFNTNNDQAAGNSMIDTCKENLNKMELLVPPSNYTDLYNELKEGINGEKDYLDTVRKYYDYGFRINELTETELADFEAITQKMTDYSDSNKFTDSVLNIVSKLREEIGE